jgi:hypothetical protein
LFISRPAAAQGTWESQMLRSILKGSPVVLSVIAAACISPSPARGQNPAGKNSQSSTAVCSVDEPSFDPATDVNGIANYKRWVSRLLRQRKFDELECIAQSARANKTRFSGGEWKIHKFYVGLEEPNPGMHSTEHDWKTHLALLQQWSDAKPGSITPRTALAGAYSDYGWFARGGGYADTVSDSGWQLLQTRMRKSENILNEVSSFKDVEWFVIMEHVARGEQWPMDRAVDLVQKAIAFEPGYFYYQRVFATFLLPKWYGQAGDTSHFIAASADVFPLAQRDGIYFLIAMDVMCACDEPELKNLSWARLLHGYKQVERQYGASMNNLNSLALMAVKFNDPPDAYDALQKIGDDWDSSVWGTQEYFEHIKDWTATVGQLQDEYRAIRKIAEGNRQTPQGDQYGKIADQIFAGILLSTCSSKAQDIHEKFDMYLKIGGMGNVTGVIFGPDDPQKLIGCLMGRLVVPRPGQPSQLAPPPSADYWLQVHVDPAPVQASVR